MIWFVLFLWVSGMVLMLASLLEGTELSISTLNRDGWGVVIFWPIAIWGTMAVLLYEKYQPKRGGKK